MTRTRHVRLAPSSGWRGQGMWDWRHRQDDEDKACETGAIVRLTRTRHVRLAPSSGWFQINFSVHVMPSRSWWCFCKNKQLIKRDTMIVTSSVIALSLHPMMGPRLQKSCRKQ
jgi:hypothetical protein